MSGTFLLLPESRFLPAEEGPTMLGAVCEEPDNPISQLYPRNPSAFIKEKIVKVCLNSAEVVVSSASARNFTLGLRLPKLMEAAHRRTNESEYKLTSQSVRTFTLTQQRDAFDSIMEDEATKRSIIKLLLQGIPLYQIVAYRTCTSGHVRKMSDVGGSGGLSLTLPVSTILGLVFPAVAPIVAAIPNPEMGTDNMSKRVSIVDVCAPDEVIFAMEYREVLSLEPFIRRFLHIRRPNPGIGGLVKGEGGMMGGRDEDEEISSEGSDEEPPDEANSTQGDGATITIGNGLKANTSKTRDEDNNPFVLKEIGADEEIANRYAVVEFGDL